MSRRTKNRGDFLAAALDGDRCGVHLLDMDDDTTFAKCNPRRLTIKQSVQEVADALTRGEDVTPRHPASVQVRGAILCMQDMQRGFDIARACCRRLGVDARKVTKDGLDPRNSPAPTWQNRHAYM